MATLPEVDSALRGLVARLAEVDPELRRKHVLERSVSCRVADLRVVYSARLTDDGITGLTTEPCDPAQVRLSIASDDLLALLDGRLAVPTAWATGRLQVEANLLDLLKLRSLL